MLNIINIKISNSTIYREIYEGNISFYNLQTLAQSMLHCEFIPLKKLNFVLGKFGFSNRREKNALNTEKEHLRN